MGKSGKQDVLNYNLQDNGNKNPKLSIAKERRYSNVGTHFNNDNHFQKKKGSFQVETKITYKEPTF
jgi:hypothetical protein